MTAPLQTLYQHTYDLTAAQCNAQGELAPAQLVQQIIEVATEHADRLGVGFKDLEKTGTLWVLSRIAIEMSAYPRLMDRYTLSTWIEGYNRHFSERNIEIRHADGHIFGYARTIWVAIDIHSRRPADLTAISYISDTVLDRPCPIEKQGKIRPVEPPQIVHDYTFRVSDIDINRHVNSTRYVELIMNQMDLGDFDDFFLHRFEIEYKQEAHYGETVEVDSALTSDGLITRLTIGERTITLARSVMAPRNTDPISGEQ